MLNKYLEWFRNSTELEKAIVISIIAGIVIAAVLIIEIQDERFSSLYIYPDSYNNYPEGSTASFIYGVKSYELANTSYDLEIFIGSRLVDKKKIELAPGKIHEERETLDITGVKFPEKVELVLKSPFNTYDAHYWLKKPEEIPTPTITPMKTSGPSQTNTSTPVPSATQAPAHTPVYVAVLIDATRGFSPQDVSINAGDSVRWANNDRRERKFTLVSSEGILTRVIDVDKRFEFTFNASGTYSFYLKEYPNIKGKVIVS